MANTVNRYGLDFLRKEHVLDEVGSTKNPRHHNAAAPLTRVSSTASSSTTTIDTEALVAAAAHKPDLEKQFDVIHFLQAHRSAGHMPPSVIYQRTGIDLEEESNANVAEMLQRNPKIKVETVPDPENPSLTMDTYAYQAKYNHVRDRKTLLAQINRCKNGVPMRDMIDSYDTVQSDLEALICAGDIIALHNTEDKDKVLFPRGEPFLVELDGIINPPAEKKKTAILKKEEEQVSEHNNNNNNNNNEVVKMEIDTPPSTKEKSNGETIKDGTKDTTNSDTNNNGQTKDDKPPEVVSSSQTGNALDEKTSEETAATAIGSMLPPPKPVYCVETDSDPTTQIRRGEAIQIGGTWFRVSSAVKEGPLKDQPVRAQAPLSVVSRKDLSKRNELDGYIRPFTEKILPADAKLPKSCLDNLKKAKEARELLLKLAHGGRAGGAASQLLGTHAHASNPVALAASLGTSHASGARRRPHKHTSSLSQGGASNTSTSTTTNNNNNNTNAKTRQLAQEAMQKLKEAALDPYLSLYSHPRRHGCTKDVRELYLKTRAKIPQNDKELKQALIEHKLLDPGEEMRRQRLSRKTNVDNDGKPKKRRYYERKNQRMTNTHLEGTEIGAALRRATEKQQQGQQVGDGGM